MYFSWSKKLWYVESISDDGAMVFVEDCKTEKVRWIDSALLDDIKEVKLTEC